MSNHTVEVLDYIDLSETFRHIWRIKLDGVEMNVKWSTACRPKTAGKVTSILTFSNPNVIKHKDYEEIRGKTFYALKQSYRLLNASSNSQVSRKGGRKSLYFASAAMESKCKAKI